MNLILYITRWTTYLKVTLRVIKGYRRKGGFESAVPVKDKSDGSQKHHDDGRQYSDH